MMARQDDAFSANAAKKLNHIKEAHIIQAPCFFIQPLLEKVIWCNQIKKAYDIETHDWQMEIIFFSLTTARNSYQDHSYQGSI